MELPKELLDLTRKESTGFAGTWTTFLGKLYRYRLLLQRRWWILFLTGALGMAVALGLAALQPSLFVSVSRMMVSGKVSIPDGASYSEELANFFGTQVELMRSGEVQRRARERVAALRPEQAHAPVSLDVTQLRGTAIFMLSATSPDPAYVQLFLDACMEEYINSKREIRSEKSESTVTAITSELVRLEKELLGGEQELLDFQKKNNVGFLQEEGNSAATYLATLNRQIANLRTERDLLSLLDIDQNLERTRKAVSEDNQAPGDAPPLSSLGPETEYLKARQQLDVLKAQREDFGKMLRPAHPTMIQLEEDIARLETLITTFRNQSIEQLKTRLNSISLQLQNLEKVGKEWEAKALDVGQRMAEYERMKSKVDRTKAVYDRLLTSLRNVDVTQRIDQDLVSILEKASPAGSQRAALPKRGLLGLIAGLAVGLLIFFVLELIDDRITSYPQLQGHFPDPVLAQIPEEPVKAGVDVAPLQIDDPRHALAESFRSLRSSIFYLPSGDTTSLKSLLVTSAVPNEGKSLVATNLALTLAFGESRVLLIDADVRRGNLHGIFKLANSPGLGDVLLGQADVRACVQSTPVERLSLLSRGVQLDHPGEYLLGKKFDHLLEEVLPHYDYVVIDTAPVMVADDTASLAPKADACIFVVRFALSAANVSRKGLEILKTRQAKVLGLVCNHVHTGMPEYYYHYQYPEYYGTSARA